MPSSFRISRLRVRELAPILLERFDGLADGLLLGPQGDPADDESVAALVHALH